MANANGISEIANRYANALYGLSEEKKATDAVSKDMAAVIGALDSSSDLVVAFEGPIATVDEKVAVVGDVADKLKMNAVSKKFLQLLASKRRLAALRAIVDAFEVLAAKGRGEVTAVVTSVSALKPADIEAIKDALQKQLDATVVVEEKVDESIIGGLIVQVGDRMIDSSVNTKLQKLKLAMKE